MKSLAFVLFVAACSSAPAKPSPVVVEPPKQIAVVPDAAPTIVEQPKVVEAPKKVVEPPKPIAPTTFDDAMAQGKAFAKSADADDAKLMFDAAAKLSPKSAAPHIELARLAIDANQKAVAIAEANKAVKRAPESSAAYNTLGRAERLRFGYDNAVLAFRQATELDAKNVWAWNNLGLVYLETKQYAEAVDALLTATALPNAESYMWNNLGTAYEQLDQLDDARTAFGTGGKLGSTVAAASAKRLEGVKSVAIAPTNKVPDLKDKTYVNTEDNTPAADTATH